MTGVEAYPLTWPTGWKRTNYRTGSKFKTSFTRARDLVFDELRRMGATKPILSTNLTLRRDGLPLANQRNPSDPGVAVYFQYKPSGAPYNAQPKTMVLACDSYLKIEENIYAIAKTIEALRGIERWGASDMMERAFTGFAALSSSSERHWRVVLGIADSSTLTAQVIDEHFRVRAPYCHPDTGGSHEAMTELNRARREALAETAR
jgi:hypothetical protein